MRKVTHEEAVALADKLARERQSRNVTCHNPVTVEEAERIVSERPFRRFIWQEDDVVVTA